MPVAAGGAVTDCSRRSMVTSAVRPGACRAASAIASQSASSSSIASRPFWKAFDSKMSANPTPLPGAMTAR